MYHLHKKDANGIFPLYLGIWPLSEKLHGVSRSNFLSCPCFWIGHCSLFLALVFEFTFLPWDVLWRKQGKEWGSKRWIKIIQSNDRSTFQFFTEYVWILNIKDSGSLRQSSLSFRGGYLSVHLIWYKFWYQQIKHFPVQQYFLSSILSTFC